MKDIVFPDDLAILGDNINLMFTQEGGLINKIGFRATVDGELAQNFWDVQLTPAKAQEAFDDIVFPNLRILFEEELTDKVLQERLAEEARQRAEARAERLAKAAIAKNKPVENPDHLVPDVGPAPVAPVVAKKGGRPKKVEIATP